MQQATIETLRELNRQFYRIVAGDFSRSRVRLQPGLDRILEAWPGAPRVLDLGCGDGRFGRALLERQLCEAYLGVDESEELLRQFGLQAGMRLESFDLLGQRWPPDWQKPRFDAVVSFSVLHHIPGRRLRAQFLEDLAACRKPGAFWAISVWQVLHRERFRRRQVDWSEIGVSPGEVEDGDLLLDWQRGERALRYVHHFEEAELIALVEESGLRVTETWRSDGDSDDLGLYVIGH